MATKTIRPARSTNGKISAVNMVIALARSGVPLDGIALMSTLTDAQRDEVRAALA